MIKIYLSPQNSVNITHVVGLVLTTMMHGLMQNQQALHHSQNVQLFGPSIISMSSMNRLPPAKARARHGCSSGCKRLQKVGRTVNVADADDLKERQKQQHPAGDKLVDERHPVYSCLLAHTHNHTPQRVKRLT